MAGTAMLPISVGYISYKKDAMPTELRILSQTERQLKEPYISLNDLENKSGLMYAYEAMKKEKQRILSSPDFDKVRENYYSELIKSIYTGLILTGGGMLTVLLSFGILKYQTRERTGK